MERTLTRSIQKSQRTVLLPGATLAEPWEVWTTGVRAECVAVCQEPSDSAARGATLALPVAQVIALPLWLRETDARQLPGMIALQVESRGLLPRGREAVFDWSIVAEEGERTLVLVGVLPAFLPQELETDACPVFEISARCQALPENALLLWMEHDRLVLAVTRDHQLVYFHALADETLTARAIQDVICVVSSLQMQGVIERLHNVVVWIETTPAEASSLQAALGVPVRQEARPAPMLPAKEWNLTPMRVGDVRRYRVSRRRWVSAAFLFGLLLLGAASAMGLRLFLAERDVAQLRHWQASHAASLLMVHDTEAAWHDLRPAIDADSYPLEALLHVTESLPADQVRITLFEAEGNHLLIKAEAKNLTAAFQFFDALKKNPHLPGYSWDMAQPHSLANDVTQVQIEGTYATHD